MIGNIIDNRKHCYRFKKLTAIIEPTWHDNSCVDADQASKSVSEGIGYEEYSETSMAEIMAIAMQLPYTATIFLYDLGEGISEEKVTQA